MKLPKKQACKICKNKFYRTSPSQKYCGKLCKAKANHPAWIKARKSRGLTRKKSLIDSMGGKCSKCGYSKSLGGLVFHHVDEQSKSFTLDQSNLYKYNEETINQEASKCILLCQNCHAELHEAERIKKHFSSNLKPDSIWRRKKGVTRKTILIQDNGGKCSICGYNSDYIQAYSFHHIDPKNKSFEINCQTLKSKNIEEINKEVSKCQLLCLNCHHEIHYD